MPQYDNPAAFLADPSTAPNNPGLEGALGAQRQQQAAPFLQELLKQQQMNTQRQSTELQEFQSPLAAQQRQSERQKIIDQGKLFHDTMQDEVTKSHEAARLAPYATDEQIAKAKLDSQNYGHLFQSAPSTYFTGIFPFVEKMKAAGMKDEDIAPIYNQFVKNSGFDTSKMDDDIKEWKPSTFGALAAHRFAQVYTPEQEQAIQKANVPAQASKDVATIQGKYRLAEINRQIQAGVYGDIGRQQGVLERALRSNIDPDTNKPMDAAGRQATADSLRRIKSKNVLEFVNKQTEMERVAKMVGMMSGDPVKTKAANDAYESAVQDATRRALQAEGLDPKDFAAANTPKRTGVPTAADLAKEGIMNDPSYNYRWGANGKIEKKKKGS